MTDLCEIVITAPDADWLHSFTRELVIAGLASSVHNFTPIRSTYRWNSRIHDREEGRASLHTRAELIPLIVERATADHPYEVPGVSARPIIGGNPAYLQWIEAETNKVALADTRGESTS